MVDEFHENDHLAADGITGAAESVDIRPFRLPEFSAEPAAVDSAGEVNLRIELGRAYLPSDELVKLSEGSVVMLDSQAGEPVDVYIGGALVGRGELQALEEKF